jgi:hypothetical protein
MSVPCQLGGVVGRFENLCWRLVVAGDMYPVKYCKFVSGRSARIEHVAFSSSLLLVRDRSLFCCCLFFSFEPGLARLCSVIL